MIVKVISTQGKDKNGEPLFYMQDTDELPKKYIPLFLEYLKTNAAHGLLKYETIQDKKGLL